MFKKYLMQVHTLYSAISITILYCCMEISYNNTTFVICIKSVYRNALGCIALYNKSV